MSVNFNSGNYAAQNTAATKKDDEVTAKDISSSIVSILATTKKEDARSNFDETFEIESLDENEQAKDFVEGLSKYKTQICKNLGISEEKYDSLCCVALALASQETGMGEEEGYNSENTGFGKFTRSVCIDLFGKASASSGLTQNKIYDFLNGSSGLSENEINLLKSLGIEANGKSSNNLYDNPDLCAAATVVILSNLDNQYGTYTDAVSKAHYEVAKEISSGEIKKSSQECYQKGENLIEELQGYYNQLSTSEEQEEFRNDLKDWFLSSNGSKDGFFVFDKEYNEEANLKELNAFLKEKGFDREIEQSELDYLRYYLTDESNTMTKTEALPYFYQKGETQSAYQTDRFLASKLGSYFKTPEVFDYDQYVQNVDTLTEYYAQELGLSMEEVEQNL